MNSPAGYLFGSVNSNARLVDDFLTGDIFTYVIADNDRTYFIKTQMPNVYLKVDVDNILKYEYTDSPNKVNKFSLLGDRDNSRLRIMYQGGCLSYNTILNRFYVKACSLKDDFQVFIPRNADTGEVVGDFFPRDEDNPKPLLIE